MSHRRQQKRIGKARRHGQSTSPCEQPWPNSRLAGADATHVVVREASHAERLAYARSQAAEALGISRSTLRRLLPHLETIEMPWGGKLIPVDELKRLVAERRRAGSSPRPMGKPGRRASIRPELAERMKAERVGGRSLRAIAAGLNGDGIPTAHGGARWWPSTVRSVLAR